MTIEEAITTAQENGCKTILTWQVDENRGHIASRARTQDELFLDPSFWQSLGKALGWKQEYECPLACCGGICPIELPMWQSQMHQFIDHLAQGKSPETFFKTLA